MVVVGAGVAGLSAAATLLEHNVSDVIVLEASGHIGGRAHTLEFGMPLVKFVLYKGIKCYLYYKPNAVSAAYSFSFTAYSSSSSFILLVLLLLLKSV